MLIFHEATTLSTSLLLASRDLIIAERFGDAPKVEVSSQPCGTIKKVFAWFYELQIQDA